MRRASPWRPMVATLGGFVFVTGSVSLLGHLCNQPTWFHWWGDRVGMAANTAVALMTTGLAIVMIALES